MKFKILCENDVYPWAIGEFIEKFSTSYLKLETLRKILQMYKLHILSDDNIYIKTSNIYKYTTKTVIEHYIAESQSSITSIDEIKKDKYYLFGKDENPETFWKIFERNTRPNVFIKHADNYSQILTIPESEFKFTKIEVNSPPSFEFHGAASTIIDLFYAGEREERKRITFANEMVNQSINNLQGIVKTEELIETSNISDGLKMYAKTQLENLMENQNRINKRLGVNNLQIDEMA